METLGLSILAVCVLQRQCYKKYATQRQPFKPIDYIAWIPEFQ